MSQSPPVPSSPSAARAEYDEVQARLASRRSIEHYAHAAVSIFVGLIFAGATSKLYWDTELKFLEVELAFALVSAGLLTHAVARLSLGRRAMQREDAELPRLTALRRELGVDDPRPLP